METVPSRWFALYTRHQHEKSVAQSLSRKGLEVFLPLYAGARQWKDRVKEITLPLFPNYVFVNSSHERRAEILSTLGVYDFVRLGTLPAPIPDEEIEAIRQAVDQGKHAVPYHFLGMGERVRVKSGPLKGLEGILVRRKSLYRLILSVELLARSIAVEVNVFDVERTTGSIGRRGLPAIARRLGDSVQEEPAPIKVHVL